MYKYYQPELYKSQGLTFDKFYKNSNVNEEAIFLFFENFESNLYFDNLLTLCPKF